MTERATGKQVTDEQITKWRDRALTDWDSALSALSDTLDALESERARADAWAKRAEENDAKWLREVGRRSAEHVRAEKAEADLAESNRQRSQIKRSHDLMKSMVDNARHDIAANRVHEVNHRMRVEDLVRSLWKSRRLWQDFANHQRIDAAHYRAAAERQREVADQAEAKVREYAIRCLRMDTEAALAYERQKEAEARADKFQATVDRVAALRDRWLADEPCQDWTPHEVACMLSDELGRTCPICEDWIPHPTEALDATDSSTSTLPTAGDES